jgi:hypothetical protein
MTGQRRRRDDRIRCRAYGVADLHRSRRRETAHVQFRIVGAIRIAANDKHMLSTVAPNVAQPRGFVVEQKVRVLNPRPIAKAIRFTPAGLLPASKRGQSPFELPAAIAPAMKVMSVGFKEQPRQKDSTAAHEAKRKASYTKAVVKNSLAEGTRVGNPHSSCSSPGRYKPRPTALVSCTFEKRHSHGFLGMELFFCWPVLQLCRRPRDVCVLWPQ